MIEVRCEVLDQICWPEKPLLKNNDLWKRNVELVKMLCRIARVVLWLNGQSGKDEYTHMPYHYEIDGVTIQFLPHWGFYDVGGVNLPVPCNEKEVRDAVEAVKKLKILGFGKK